MNWLDVEDFRKLVQAKDSILFIIELKNHFALDENKSICFLILDPFFVQKLHTDPIKYWDILKYNPFMERENIRMVLSLVYGLSLEYEKLVQFLLVHYKVFTRDDCQRFFAVGLLDSYDFVGFSSLGCQERDWDGFDVLEVPVVVYQQVVFVGHDDHLEEKHFHAFCSVKILLVYADSEIVGVFALVNFETFLVCFVSYAISSHFPNYHL